MSGSIQVSRDSGYADRLRDYLVVVDGQELGRIKNGATVTLSVEPGPHELVIKIDWCGSNTIKFDLKPGETVYFTCGSSLRGARLFASLYYVLFARDEYLWLRTGN